MFVKNLSQSELLFKKNGNVLKLKPGVNCVDEMAWSIDELKRTYGPTAIVIIGEDALEAIEPKVEAPAKEEPKAEEPVVLPADGEGIIINGEEAGDGDLAVDAPAPDEPVADKEEADAPKTEEAPKAKATKGKAGKKNK